MLLIFLVMANQEPFDLQAITTLYVAENQPIGTVVGEFNATDPDYDANITFFGSRLTKLFESISMVGRFRYGHDFSFIEFSIR